jgi:zinc D-Ala-D-Ala carboxypeptidase
MSFTSTQRRPAVSPALIAFTVMLLLLALNPAIASAQSQLCTNCTLYARTELNLRQGPSLNAAVLRFIPAGAAVHRTTGAESNGYAPVTYDGVSGWAVALGFVATPAEIDAAAAPSAPATAPATTTTTTSTTTSETRFTLAPLMLRSGPAVDDEPVLVIPEGARLTLTQQGAENGYVTVDYDGVTGWVYADLIARQDELR